MQRINLISISCLDDMCLNGHRCLFVVELMDAAHLSSFDGFPFWGHGFDMEPTEPSMRPWAPWEQIEVFCDPSVLSM